MGFGIKLKVSGNYACFSRPEMKVERVSYDVITPSAARGIIEAIYWKPAIRWVIDRIHVINEIKFTNFRRNEVSEKISIANVERAMKNGIPFYLNANECRQQRASLVLRDVCYVIEAHFELTDLAGPGETEEKHYAIACERIKKGKCHCQPCFGTREFGANFELVDRTPLSFYENSGSKDLGFMLWDMEYPDGKNDDYDVKPVFFRATMNDGTIDVANVLKVS